MKKSLEKFLQYTSRNFFSCWLILGVDTIIASLCTLFTFVGIHYITGIEWNAIQLIKVIAVALLSSVVGDLIFNTFRNTIRYSEIKDLWRITCSVLFKTACMAVFVFFFFKGDKLFGSQNLVFVISDGMLTLVTLIGLRVLVIVTYESLIGIVRKTDTKILIYGTDDKSVALKTRLRNSSHYKIAGFCIYSPDHSRRILVDSRVYSFSNKENFDLLITKHHIQGILFARNESIKEEENRLLEYCKSSGIKTMIAPSISEADTDGFFHQFVRPIRIEDLLGREEIKIDMQEIASEYCNKTILVTGAAGSIGSELCRQLAQIGVRKLILFDSAETPLHNVRLEFEKKYPNIDFVPVIGDVRVKQRIRMVFDLYHPQIVFHAAAYKHVPLMEENPCEAVYVNVIGSRQIAEMAVEYEAEKMIMISTDKAVNPTNVMGASKRLAEIYVQSLGTAIKEGKVKGKTKFITTRFGNVLGSNGSVIPRFKEQIENGGPVTVTHPDIIRYFMTIPEACRLVMEAGMMGQGNEIFVFEMGEPVKIVDLAVRMIELAGYRLDEDIKIEFTGLRPGEKLYEELLSTEENTLPTSNKKIKIAKVRRYEYDDVLEAYADFENLARNVEIMNTVALMKRIVPEFISKNSRFDVLDKGDSLGEK
ncbi:NDP-sugar epimerase, includes UDP-GlcNAc-inverting 4,6-dehydratase FlaA1 and capsular polysaccharide biosynthesis protein EpsC [Bacteroides faecichinchillae]|uniref:NDP-sugar epimerase, includes UDP-GlcNAc-inverting 4,6-dehydratase FlaA1 and capsular polysaccharide biosynthesis protein EpsC n=1 Tax=Bacteroides faecichinchillae TaxID=871325 RepID=A0A1M5GFZ5_9BACE|nr:nucleoside-diphosphate sugar epimerase/dehydratase [Bacteroides faecichinchillae]THG59862.1 polysaccharide biosynthesis protein [Bacteroides faecichinchillae]SHG02616.1 NDP-sugar epimerase, includes UDP-GlcNAc-inverting 4,6-dehydratase FlaA1 and capsular polysaccharide biosynthesis protein EpsC [Bacteroides faecichinchillae]